MERLTMRTSEDSAVYVGQHKHYDTGDIPAEMNTAAVREVVVKLAALEDAQGRMEPCVNYFDFGKAIDALKKGHKVARNGWNGKKQYIELATHVSYKNSSGDIINVDHRNFGNAAIAFVGTSGVQLGWLASQADMLAGDWYIVE